MAKEMYAFSRLKDALSRTKSLLWPPEWGVWLRLAVVALFVGGGSSLPNVLSIDSMGVILRPARPGSSLTLLRWSYWGSSPSCWR